MFLFFSPYKISLFKATLNLPDFTQSYSPEDNRFDLRQFLYNARWPYQFRKIDQLVKELDGEKIPFKETGEHELMGVAASEVGGMGVVAAGSGNPKAGH